MSIAVTEARGNSRASATARQPEPVPTSATLSGAFRRSPSSSTAASTISLPQPSHGTPCSSQKGVQPLASLDAEDGLQGIPRIIDAGVDDAAVAGAGLLPGAGQA